MYLYLYLYLKQYLYLDLQLYLYLGSYRRMMACTRTAILDHAGFLYVGGAELVP